MISISDLRKVSGIGDKTIERIKEQLEQNELDNNYKSEYNTNIKLDINNIYQGDCLELMNGIPDKSVDMVLCDLPYGTTSCSWDTIIPFIKLWKQYERVVKDDGAILLFNDEKFGVALKNSNFNDYKYDWIWVKTKPSNFALANRMPMKYHEFISVFYKQQPLYNKQMIPREGGGKARTKYVVDNSNRTMHGSNKVYGDIKKYDENYKNPKSILEYTQGRPQDSLHPTEKPVELCEYFIKTYTNEGETVLDNCIGSGTTAIAAINTNRNYIGIELDESYYNIAKTRVSKHIDNLSV